MFVATETLSPKVRRSFGHKNKVWTFSYQFETRAEAVKYAREHTTRPSMTISGRSQRWTITEVN